MAIKFGAYRRSHWLAVKGIDFFLFNIFYSSWEIYIAVMNIYVYTLERFFKYNNRIVFTSFRASLDKSSQQCLTNIEAV